MHTAKHVDAVDEQGAELKRRHLAVDVHTAETDRRIHAAGNRETQRVVLHAGHFLRQILEAGDAGALHLRGAQRRDRDRDLLQALLALARGNDDLFELRLRNRR